MPVFSQQPIQKVVKKAKGIAAEVVEEYKKHIEGLKNGHEGLLHFDGGENIQLGKRALIEAGIALKKFVKVRKVRGEANALRFIKVTKKEFDQVRKKVKARIVKMTGKPRRKRAGRNGVSVAQAAPKVRGRKRGEARTPKVRAGSPKAVRAGRPKATQAGKKRGRGRPKKAAR